VRINKHCTTTADPAIFATSTSGQASGDGLNQALSPIRVHNIISHYNILMSSGNSEESSARGAPRRDFVDDVDLSVTKR